MQVRTCVRNTGAVRSNSAQYSKLPPGRPGERWITCWTLAWVRLEAGWQPESAGRLLHLRGRGCIDWTERRLHVGGPLGVALTDAMLDAGWLRRASRSRALLPSADGLRRFAQLGVRLDGAAH